jgi:hypothetical protein
VPGLHLLPAQRLWRRLSLSKPLKIQIVERARALITDEQHWCRRHLALDKNGVSVSPTSASAVKRCGLGAVLAAAYQLTNDFDAAHQLGHEALRPHYGLSTLIYINDTRGHAAVLALFDEVIAAA